jgi:hypothetical protein
VAALDAAPEDLPLVKLPVDGFEETAPTFVPGKEETVKVRRILGQAFPAAIEGPIVLLNPNASDMLPLRKWDTQNFVRLGRRILQEIPNTVLIITGAPSERESAERVCLEIGSDRTVCLAGKTTLRELLVLYTLADTLVTNDSGPGHFASMTDIHSIVLYGPETPGLFGAIGGRSHIIHAGLACSPCVNVFNHRFSPCKNNLCMQFRWRRSIRPCTPAFRDEEVSYRIYSFFIGFHQQNGRVFQGHDFRVEPNQNGIETIDPFKKRLQKLNPPPSHGKNGMA